MRRLLALAMAVAVAAACTGGGDDDDEVVVPPKAVMHVLASDSLTEAFQAIGARFAQSNPGTRVDFLFAPSSTLLEEVERGRAAGVLATANPLTMQQAVDEGYARAPVAFASNRLTVVAADGNPMGITGVTDLGRDDVRLALCEAAVICGSLARSALDRAGVERAPTTTGASARAVLGQVVAGTADAGIVFTTTPAIEQVEVIGPLTDGTEPDALYEITVLAGVVDRDGAEAWVDYVTGPEGQAVLASLGFGPAS